jgi:capsular exopolysaccharide synthesis family protein
MIENKNLFTPPHEYVQAQSRDIKLQDVINIILRRKYSIFLIISVSIAFVLINRLSEPPEYRAVSIMMINNSSAPTNPIDAVLSSGTDVDAKSSKKSVELLNSMPVAELIVKELYKNPNRNKLEFFGNRHYISTFERLFGNTPSDDKSKTEKVIKPVEKELTEEEVRQYAIELSSRMKVDPVRETNILKVSVSSPFPDEAVILSNTVCQVYKSVDINRNSEKYAQAHNFIAEMLNDQQQKMDEADAALTKYMASNEIYEVSGNVQELLGKLSEIDAKYNDMKAEYNITQNNLNFLENKLTESDKALSSRIATNVNAKLGTILEGIRSRESEYVALVRDKGVNSAEALAKRRQLDFEKTRYEQLSRSKIAGEIGSAGRAQKSSFDLIAEKLQTERKLNMLNFSAGEFSRLKQYYESKISMLPKKQQDYAKLQRDREVVGKTYVFLKQRLDETRIMLGSEVGEVRLLGSAFYPLQPESSGSFKKILSGLLFGAFIAFIYTFIREIKDNSIKDELFLKNFGFTTLAVIPFLTQLNNGKSIAARLRIQPLLQSTTNFIGDKINSVIHRNSANLNSRKTDGVLVPQMTDKLYSEFAESFRKLRTSLDYSCLERPLKSVVISGTASGEGKSTICANLGLAFALVGKKTLIVDCDLRFASQHSIFHIKREHGLTDYLFSNKDSIDAGFFKTTHVNNLFVLTAGHLVSNPNEVLGSAKMQILIKELEGKFDKILFDTPPHYFSDAAQLVRSVDGLILSARLNFTSRNLLKEFTEDPFLRPYLLGIALIDPRNSRLKKYGKYGYAQFEKKSDKFNNLDVSEIQIPPALSVLQNPVHPINEKILN